MAMSRKDYTKFANMLNNVKPSPTDELAIEDAFAHHMWLRLVHETANIFGDDSTRFDRPRFYEACGVE
jgi:hypothetical protein